MDRPEDDAPSVLSPFTKPDPEHTPVFNRKAFVKFPLADDESAASTGAPTSTGTKSSSSRRSKATAPAVTPLVNAAEEAAPKAERKVAGASTMGDKKRPLGRVAAIVALGILGAGGAYAFVESGSQSDDRGAPNVDASREVVRVTAAPTTTAAAHPTVTVASSTTVAAAPSTTAAAAETTTSTSAVATTTTQAPSTTAASAEDPPTTEATTRANVVVVQRSLRFTGSTTQLAITLRNDGGSSGNYSMSTEANSGLSIPDGATGAVPPGESRDVIVVLNRASGPPVSDWASTVVVVTSGATPIVRVNVQVIAR